jgi:hypothetical protein
MPPSFYFSHRYSNFTRVDFLLPEKERPSPACVVHETGVVVGETDIRPIEIKSIVEKG